MKRYEAPQLVARGDVTELTLGPVGGRTDPDHVTFSMPTGSIGFNL